MGPVCMYICLSECDLILKTIDFIKSILIHMIGVTLVLDWAWIKAKCSTLNIIHGHTMTCPYYTWEESQVAQGNLS